jgi:hypothetical protein
MFFFLRATASANMPHAKMSLCTNVGARMSRALMFVFLCRYTVFLGNHQ